MKAAILGTALYAYGCGAALPGPDAVSPLAEVEPLTEGITDSASQIGADDIEHEKKVAEYRKKLIEMKRMGKGEGEWERLSEVEKKEHMKVMYELKGKGKGKGQGHGKAHGKGEGKDIFERKLHDGVEHHPKGKGKEKDHRNGGRGHGKHFPRAPDNRDPEVVEAERVETHKKKEAKAKGKGWKKHHDKIDVVV
mmetsp:Transcript_16826/g.45543  ORF Transcript_16826/g.45543 Transcript_16826/m.45543 type:complete len:194 (-) Transcript_16826:144-725(-)|eukprot:CAMPEP_0194488140 /NCGR_PEP_ID=MMETSP0253-20130528/8177_1 /TAXON_ID=2966 /ORGANISM="Noctiluca scintillans" /LENGTH=193 /DNA_ID=CAMNT_0039328467 /DNA_START=76 /DNA_END=657 /DNA_ORIENTATION=-